MAIRYKTKGDKKVYENDTINAIPVNKTLFINKSTYEDVNRPEIAKVNTIQDVFDFYRPEMTIALEDQSGVSTKETFSFNHIEDFDKEALAKRSPLLQSQKVNAYYYLEIAKAINTIPALKDAISDPNSKSELLALIRSLRNQLDEY